MMAFLYWNGSLLHYEDDLDGLVQDCSISIANALEILQSCTKREREIKFIGLFEERGHRGPYSPYKPFNHNLYIGIIIFPHIDNPQSTGYN